MYEEFNSNCPMKTIESKCSLQTYQGAYKACSEISAYCPLWYVRESLVEYNETKKLIIAKAVTSELCHCFVELDTR